MLRKPWLIGLAALGMAIAAAVPATTASASTGTSFTEVSSSANPVLVGVAFTVKAQECNRIADNPPTGQIVFRDKTTGVALGSVATTADPTLVNCSDASISDTESLAAGTYTIKASYQPGGATPAAASKASYKQKVKTAAFTRINWTEGAAVPNAHEEGAAVGLDGRVYDISGSTGDCSDGGCGSMQPAVDVYNPTTNTFKTAAPIPNPRTEDPAAVVVNGSIYVLGGVDGTTVSAIDEYVPGTGWTTLPAASDLPSGFGGAFGCAAASGTDIYYFDPVSHEVGTLDTTADPPSWTESAAQALLNPSSFCSAVTDGSHIVIVGAGNGSPDANSQRVLDFTPSSGAMTLAQGQTVPTAEQSADLLDGTVVIAGGDFNFNAVEGVAPGAGSVATYSNLPDNRDDAAGGSVVSGRFYIVGGRSTATTTPDVLIGTPH
jgi:hypothetical protein